MKIPTALPATYLRLLALAAMTCVLGAFTAASAQTEFSYSYGHPQTPLTDGYIINTSNAVLYSEGNVRCWKPNVGGTTFANTTPGIVDYYFDFGQSTSDISLWMNMPTFHWNYSQGHNFLFGSNDGVVWTQLAELEPPAFGSARDLGTVNIPPSLIGPSELYLRVEMYSYGPSAPSGGVATNTAQLSRYDISSNNTSFSLTATLVPEPSGLALSCLPGILGFVCWRRRRPS